MGWLGYFIGKSGHLKNLFIRPFEPPSGASVRDVLDPFFRGVSCNKSIEYIDLAGMDMQGGEVLTTMLGSFFRNNHNLTRIYINNCNFGDEGGRTLALALGSRTHKSLKDLSLRNSNISEEVIVDIITALGMYPNLQHLDLGGSFTEKRMRHIGNFITMHSYSVERSLSLHY